MRFLLLFTLIPHLLFPTPAVIQPQQDEISNVKIDYLFGEKMSLTASISEPEKIDHAIIVVQPAHGEQTQYSAGLNTEGNLSAEIELSSGTFSPYDRIYYWIDLYYNDGTQTTSPSYWFDYNDNRFEWVGSTSKWFNIFFTESTKLSAIDLQQIALSGLKKATQILPSSPSLPITIYVYPDVDSLQSTLALSSKEWIIGKSLPEMGVILVSSSEDLDSRVSLEQQIPHEIMHLLEFELTQNSYSSAPVWLLEGLATNAETYPNSEHARVLNNAIGTKNWISINKLCTNFSPSSNDAVLAYAESASFVNFLVEKSGSSKIIELLQSANTGKSCANMVQSTYGQTLDSLEQQWLETTFGITAADQLINKSWLLLPLALFIVSLIILLTRRKMLRSHQARLPHDKSN